SPPRRGDRRGVYQIVLRTTGAFIREEEKGAVLANGTTQSPAESVGVHLLPGSRKRVSGVQTIPLEKPKARAVILIAAALAHDGEIRRLGILRICTGSVHAEFGDAFDRRKQITIGAARPDEGR